MARSWFYIAISALPLSMPSTTSAQIPDDAVWLNAVKMAGYQCRELLDIQPLNEDASVVRVRCSDPSVYIATLESDGQIRITPMAYIAPPGRQDPK